MLYVAIIREPKYKPFDSFQPVVSTKDCFDVLLTPLDHVSRRPTDTYYVNDTHLLRTHTSVYQVPLLKKHDAFLVFADVYRRDEIDSTHYPIFHQMEAVRVFNEVSLIAKA